MLVREFSMHKIETIRELVHFSENELMNIKGLGRRSFREIKNKLLENYRHLQTMETKWDYSI